MMTPPWRQIVQEVSTATSLEDALPRVVRRVRNSLSVDVCSVYLADEGSDQFVLMASDGLGSESAGRIRVGQHEGPLGLVREGEELVYLASSALGPLVGAAAAAAGEQRHSFLGMPLIHHHRLLGVLAAWKREHRQFLKEEVALLVMIAPHLAKTIHEAGTVGAVRHMLSGGVAGDAFIQGLQAAAGVAIGTATPVDTLATLESTPDRPVRDVEAETVVFKTAVAAVQDELRRSREGLAGVPTDEVLALFDVHVQLLSSERLLTDAIARIRAGNWAPGAWRDAIVRHAQVFGRIEDPYLRARADDIREIGRRVLSRLRPETVEAREYPERCILVGETVGITEVAAVPAGRLAGIVSRHGSASSHMAVLARSLGIPAVVSLAALPAGELAGRTMVVDGYRGRIFIEPSRPVLDAFQLRIDEDLKLSERLTALRGVPSVSPDGVRLPLRANVGLPSDSAAARREGAEGAGLYRTEYFFLLREAFPTEDEQYQAYREVVASFVPSPVVLRTLDVGGDKTLPYFPDEQEDNPFLGCRGIRFSLEHPEFFLIQMRALLRANAGLGNLQVLFPMISKLAEFEEALCLLGRAHRELLAEGQAAEKPRVGVMVEVPSSVYLAGALAARADFVSIGTNDLTQYMLAADRNNARVATPYDSLHPAVLDAIQRTIEGAHRHGKPTSVCGELAGDPAGALALMGMKVDSLSMSPANLSRVKLVIRSFTSQRARTLLDAALEMEDGLAVHRLLNSALEDAGLGQRLTTMPEDLPAGSPAGAILLQSP